jgi:5'-phosphate synthase pdxT subunit
VVPVIGVLALQGDFQAHARVLGQVGGEAREVRTPRDLEAIDGLVIPGGESTVIAAGLEREGLAAPITDLVNAGTPLLGTCAGLILAGHDHLGLIDLQARRNAFGRQLRSFETDLDIAGLDGGPLRAVFIRAPWIDSAGDGVELLAHVDDHPVAARQGHVTVVAFHPELSGDSRLHEQWLTGVRDRPRGSQGEPVADDVLGHHA